MPDDILTDRAVSRWIGGLFHRHGGRTALIALVLPLLSGALLLGQAYLLADILHRAIIESLPPADLTAAIALLAGVFLFRSALGATGEIVAVAASEAIKAHARRALFAAILDRGPLWTRSQSSGALGTLMVEQVEALDGFFSRYMPAMIQASILPLAFAAIAFPIDWMVGLLFLVTAPLIPVFMALAGLGAEAATRAQAGALSRLGGRFADRLRGLVTLRLFGREQVETESIYVASENLRNRTMRVMRIAFLSSAVLEFFAALGVAGVALYIGLTFLDLVTLRGSELTLRAGLFCLLLAPEVYQPLRLLAAHFHDRATAKAAAADIAANLGALPAVLAGAPTLPQIPSNDPAAPLSLTLAGLDLLSPTGHPLLQDAHLDLAPGAHVALLGPSGSGKSSVLEALARLRPCTGTIRLGGTVLAAMPEPELRARVAMLGQRPRLFAGTIADNIRLGRRDACDTAVHLAARRAMVTAFADPLPLGLETAVGENGLGLSGGEIQRVALARIYLRRPDLILLDEPTAHLDEETEAAVLDGLLEFATGRTLLVATHSAAVAARMDRRYRIADGRLLSGPHAVAEGGPEKGAA